MIFSPFYMAGMTRFSISWLYKLKVTGSYKDQAKICHFLTHQNIVQEVHRSRGIGLWLVLLNIYAVIGRSSNMRWS